jgi:Ca-activated chloride channel homolog
MRSYLAFVLLLAAWEPFRSEQKDVREGNEKYQQGDYGGAGESYSRALPLYPGEPAVRFDLGAAMYQLWRQAPDGQAKAPLLEAARSNWKMVAENPRVDPRLRSRAHYNLGNLALDQQKQDEAIQSYQQALKADPDNEDARHNLELARVKKEPPPPQGNQGDKKNQQQQQQRQQQQQKPQQQDPQQQQQQAGQPQDQSQEQPQPQQGEDQPDPQKGDPKQQKEEPRPEEAPETVDDADRKLRALERRSRDLQTDKQRSEQRRGRRRAEDW